MNAVLGASAKGEVVNIEHLERFLARRDRSTFCALEGQSGTLSRLFTDILNGW